MRYARFYVLVSVKKVTNERLKYLVCHTVIIILVEQLLFREKKCFFGQKIKLLFLLQKLILFEIPSQKNIFSHQSDFSIRYTHVHS